MVGTLIDFVNKSIELKAIQDQEEWYKMEEITKKCYEFLNCLYDSSLMKAYNVSSMSLGYKVRKGGVDHSRVTKEHEFKDELDERFKEIYKEYEGRVEELNRHHQIEMVSVI